MILAKISFLLLYGVSPPRLEGTYKMVTLGNAALKFRFFALFHVLPQAPSSSQRGNC